MGFQKEQISIFHCPFWKGVSFFFQCDIASVVKCLRLRGRGSSVGRARDSWLGGPGFDHRCGRPLPTGWVGVSIM